MKIYSVGDLKANFSQVLDMVQEGEEVGIAYGRKKKIVARIIPSQPIKRKKRKLGPLKGKASFRIIGEWRMTDEEFLNS